MEDGTGLTPVDCWLTDCAYHHNETDEEGKSVEVIDWRIYYSSNESDPFAGALTDMTYDELTAEIEKMKAYVLEPRMTPFSEFIREEGGELTYPWDIAEIEEIQYAAALGSKTKGCEILRERKWIAALLLAAVLLTLPGCGGFMKSSPDPTPAPTPTLSPEELEELRRAEEEERAARELAEKTEKYNEAKELLYTRKFDEAYALFTELGEFNDSAELAAYTKSYQAGEPEYGDRAIDDAYLAKEFPEGKLYSLSDYGALHGMYYRFKGMLYVPDEINAETAFVQYFGGGGHEEDYLWYEGVYSYFDMYYPNAIIVFTNESGTTHISERVALQWDVLRQVAYECGTVVHDLGTIASSNGCYTAMQLCYDYYVNYGIPVKRFVALDVGVYWTLDYLALTAEQCAVVAEAGTEFHLFEEEAFYYDLEKTAVQNILKSDIKATAYICRNNGHSVISQNGYALGLFSFCAGEDVEPPAFEYYKVELTDGIDSFGEVSWPPKPESDTRKVW